MLGSHHMFSDPARHDAMRIRPRLRFVAWSVLLSAVITSASAFAAALLTAGITAPGTNIYPNPKKPVFGSPINWNRSLSTGLVSALPLNDGDGTSFNDAVAQQPCLASRLSGTAATASAPTWFTPAITSDYPWGGRAISNNGGAAQAIQSPFLQSVFINNITNGYSYAMLVQPLDT